MYPRLEAARRAGVGVDDLDRMVELGMIVPDEAIGSRPGDVRKAGFLASLQSGGLPLDAVAAEIGNGTSRSTSSTTRPSSTSRR